MSVVIYTEAGRLAFSRDKLRCALDRHERDAPTLDMHPSEWSDFTPPEGENGAAVVMQ